MSSLDYIRNHAQSRRNRSPSPSLAKYNSERLAAIVDKLATEHREKHPHWDQDPGPGSGPGLSEMLEEVEMPVCCPLLQIDAAGELQKSFCAVTRRRLAIDQDKLVRDVMAKLRRSGSSTTRKKSSSISSVTSRRDPSARLSLQPSMTPRERSSATDPESEIRRDRRGTATPEESPVLPQNPQSSAPNTISPGVPIPIRSLAANDGISGRPFVRVGTPGTPRSSTPASLSRFDGSMSEAKRGGDQDSGNSGEQGRRRRGTHPRLEQSLPPAKTEEESVDIPVGISRLHMVTLPTLQMKPIYWSPVNDVAVVLRATWFYRDNLGPLEPAVANQLEAGYRELRPWTQTWADELRCAVEVGPLGEEKVVHPLWPTEPERSSKKAAVDFEPPISSDPFCAARCFRGEAAAEGTLEVGASEDPAEAPITTKPFASYCVVYKDGNTAFLLKPSLKPSAYYGRRPVAKARQGITVGIPVVRGFDRAVWDRIHIKTRDTLLRGHSAVLAGDDPSSYSHDPTECLGCRFEKKKGQVTDLVLVAHGIGQKLAERVESFHFTHAINAFRRSMNMELGTDAVRAVLREDHNGIMVLPLNWRLALSFQDGVPMKEEDPTVTTFDLRDIEPGTIPAVRSMISDVMFDIPFFMNAHHKPQMISALVGEANRVVRLWRQNVCDFRSYLPIP